MQYCIAQWLTCILNTLKDGGGAVVEKCLLQKALLSEINSQ
jgi:hypothetical protein